MTSEGSHILCELSGCCPQALSSSSLIEEILRDGARVAQATVLNGFFHEFRPSGVTGMLCLAESHISVHTWPELEYAALDIYTCGAHALPREAMTRIAVRLGAESSYFVVLARGEQTVRRRFVNSVDLIEATSYASQLRDAVPVKRD